MPKRFVCDSKEVCACCVRMNKTTKNKPGSFFLNLLGKGDHFRGEKVVFGHCSYSAELT